LFYKALDAIMGIRVKPEDEIAGLDLPEMGVLAYPDFQLTPVVYSDGVLEKNMKSPEVIDDTGISKGVK